MHRNTRNVWTSVLFILIALLVWKTAAFASGTGTVCDQHPTNCPTPGGCSPNFGPDSYSCSTLTAEDGTSKCCVYDCYRITYTGVTACSDAPSCVDCIFAYSNSLSQCGGTNPMYPECISEIGGGGSS